MKVCCFPGTNSPKIMWEYEFSEFKFNQLKADIKNRLTELIEREYVTRFISGITSEADLFTAEIVLELKKVYPVTLECVLLSADQPLLWQPDQRERYRSIARQADSVSVVLSNRKNQFVRRKRQRTGSLKRIFRSISMILACIHLQSTCFPVKLFRRFAVKQDVDGTMPQDSYTPGCHKRLNKYLVQNGDFFMAMIKGMSEHALDTIDNAYKQGKCIFIINPNLP